MLVAGVLSAVMAVTLLGANLKLRRRPERTTQDASIADRALRLFLAQTDIACRSCGYNLRALTSDRCPECGMKLKLCLETTRVRLGLWVVCCILASVPAIGGVALIGWTAVKVDWSAALLASWGVVLLIPVAFSMLALRRLIVSQQDFCARPGWRRGLSALYYLLAYPGVLLSASLLLLAVIFLH